MWSQNNAKSELIKNNAKDGRFIGMSAVEERSLDRAMSGRKRGYTRKMGYIVQSVRDAAFS